MSRLLLECPDSIGYLELYILGGNRTGRGPRMGSHQRCRSISERGMFLVRSCRGYQDRRDLRLGRGQFLSQRPGRRAVSGDQGCCTSKVFLLEKQIETVLQWARPRPKPQSTQATSLCMTLRGEAPRSCQQSPVQQAVAIDRDNRNIMHVQLTGLLSTSTYGPCGASQSEFR